MKKMIFHFFNACIIQEILEYERKFSLKFTTETGNIPTVHLIFIITYMQATLMLTKGKQLLCFVEGISLKFSKTD